MPTYSKIDYKRRNWIVSVTSEIGLNSRVWNKNIWTLLITGNILTLGGGIVGRGMRGWEGARSNIFIILCYLFPQHVEEWWFNEILLLDLGGIKHLIISYTPTIGMCHPQGICMMKKYDLKKIISHRLDFLSIIMRTKQLLSQTCFDQKILISQFKNDFSTFTKVYKRKKNVKQKL